MNKLSKHIFVILLISCISYPAFSQNIRRPLQQQNFNNRATRPPNPGMRRIQVVKEEFIARQLSLSSGQAAKFWPIYRQYQNDLSDIRKLKRLNNSDAQANGSEQVKKDMEYDGQLVDLRKRYYEEFMKVLPPEKVSKLIKSEREFTDELVRKLHEQR